MDRIPKHSVLATGAKASKPSFKFPLNRLLYISHDFFFNEPLIFALVSGKYADQVEAQQSLGRRDMRCIMSGSPGATSMV